jgi:hypothetical protein
MFKNKKRGLTLLVLLVMALVAALSSASMGLAQDQGGLTEVGGLSAGETYATSKDAPEAARSLNVGELEEVPLVVTFDETLTAEAVKAVAGGEVTHEYNVVFNGVALAKVPTANLGSVMNMRGVTGVYVDQLLQLDTDTGPQWIGAPAVWDALGGQEMAGEGVVVGILDSGIWPETASWSDPDPNGNAYAAPAGTYECDLGSDYPDGSSLGLDFECNNKLIGAYRFMDTYDLFQGITNTEFTSARDDDSHGTHTASTVAGNSNVTATVLGNDLGTISGVAPRAQVIAYKVCGLEGCFGSDSAAAVEQAIIDGVDVINFSISGGGDPYNDIVELAFAAATDAGVFITASGGNSGPTPDTVAHRGPWTTTVAASTHNRGYVGSAMLESAEGNSLELEGVTITAGFGPADVVMAADYGDAGCLNPFPAGTFNGEIVVCERGVIARVAKSGHVEAGGAGGMILYNPVVGTLNLDSHSIPSLHIDDAAGAVLLDFMANNTGVTGTLSGGFAVEVQGDMMAAFSSRGGPGQSLGISKPDVTAPGVNILAGTSPYPAEVLGVPGEFGLLSGTSMSGPHVAGSAALMAALYPDWTPGEIKSALMTTAITDGVVKEDGVTPVDAFDVGSGRVSLGDAMNPGVTISDSVDNYFLLEDELWNSNYPSIFFPDMPGIMTVERTLQSQVDRPVAYRVTIDAPEDVEIDTGRRIIVVRSNQERTMSITVDASRVPEGEVRFATMHLQGFGPKNSGLHVRIPITLVRGQDAVTIDQSCEPTTLYKRSHTTAECTVTVENTSFESDANYEVFNNLPKRLRLINGSVDGATQVNGRAFEGSGFLAAASPPEVGVAVDPFASPYGYVPLAGFGGTIVLSGSDESISNVNVPAFSFAGDTYSQIGVVSNGYVVLGGGDLSDVDWINGPLPDGSAPNNTMAPLWTDLNPSDGGRLLVNLLGNGVDSWIVAEWESVPNYGSDGLETNTFQVWISYTQPDDISFVYGPDITGGTDGFATVGAENKFGNSGGMVYFDGAGTPPAPSFPIGDYEVDVFAVPGAPGGSATITYEITSIGFGDTATCTNMTSDVTNGISAACTEIEILNEYEPTE